MTKLSSKTTIADGDFTDDCYVHVVKPGSPNVSWKTTLGQLKTAINGVDSDIVYKAVLTILAADVLALNGTPILIIPAPAAGYRIEIITSACKVIYNSAAYAANMTIHLITDTANVEQHEISNCLNATVTRTSIGYPSTLANATDTQLISAKGVYVKAKTGNPTTGDSNIKVFVAYRIVAE